MGQKKANAWGLHDMHGNVWEWCADVYDSGFYRKTEATRKNPLCAAGSGSWVLRGGGWCRDAWYCSSALRFGSSPGDRCYFLGLRASMS